MTRFDLSDPALRRHLAGGARGPRRELVRRDQLGLGGAALRRGERAAARPPVPPGQRPLARAERHPLRDVLRLVAGDPAQPRGRRPRPDPTAAGAGVPQQDDRCAAAPLRGARERADRRLRAPRGEVEFIAEFAEPYAARIICVLLGLPEEHWRQVAHWADDLGASFSIDVGNQVPRIEAALDGLYGYVDEVVADREAEPARRPGVHPRAGHRRRRPAHPPRARASRWSSSPSPAWRPPATSSASRCRRCCSTPTSGGCWASVPTSAPTPSRR